MFQIVRPDILSLSLLLFLLFYSCSLRGYTTGEEDVSGNTAGSVVSATSLPGVCGRQEKKSSSVVTTWGLHVWSLSLEKVETLLGCGAVPSSSVALQSLQFSG